jgi:hypothetical protein
LLEAKKLELRQEKVCTISESMRLQLRRWLTLCSLKPRKPPKKRVDVKSKSKTERENWKAFARGRGSIEIGTSVGGEEVVGTMIAEARDLLVVGAPNIVGVLRGVNLTHMYHEAAAGVAVDSLDHTLVRYLAHHLLPDHLPAVHTARKDVIADAHGPTAGHLPPEVDEGTQETGGEAHLTVMIEIDLPPAVIRHAHLVPEEHDEETHHPPADHVHHRQEPTRERILGRGLDSLDGATVRSDRYLLNHGMVQREIQRLPRPGTLKMTAG